VLLLIIKLRTLEKLLRVQYRISVEDINYKQIVYRNIQIENEISKMIIFTIMSAHII